MTGGMWLNWGTTTETTLVKNGTPLSTVRGVGEVEIAQGAIAGAVAEWDRSAPLFLTIGVIAWRMTPTDLKTVTGSLNSDHAVLRGDE